MRVQHFFDPRTYTISYVVYDEATKDAVVIDPVLDYDPKSGTTWNETAESMAAFIDEHGLKLHYALDTHPHADHLTSLPWFRERFGAKTVISSGIRAVQETWQGLFNLSEGFATDGSQFDVLLEDGETLKAGSLEVKGFLTEGHTPASLTYQVGDALFVGDLLFMPDSGTARCDFPGGSAAVMYEAVKRIYELPDETRVFTGHDYQPGGRELRFESTIGDQKRENIHLNEKTTRDEFVALRKKLETGKEMPTLLFPSVQVNIAGGQLPPAEANGRSYLKIPLNLFS